MSERKKPTAWTGGTVKKLFGDLPVSKTGVGSKPPIIKPKPVKLQKSPVRGFKSKQEFRDLTRALAKRHRGATVIISGSSVTGKSFKTGKPFGSHSDIDIGLIDPKLSKSSQVDYRGFPQFASKLGAEERRLQKTFREFKGRKTGIKVFEKAPKRTYYVRPHTPPPTRKTYI
jgi:hypothetical protein